MSVGRPHNSALMKLAMRPKNSPNGVAEAATSSSERIGMPRRREKMITARMTPVMPPWNDMPPSHSRNSSSGLSRKCPRLVEDRVAEPAAADDADDQPHEKVVDVGERHRRLAAAPQPRVGDDAARIPPAEEDAGEIGQAVPAHGQRTDRDDHRVDIGKGYGEHLGPGIMEGPRRPPPGRALRGRHEAIYLGSAHCARQQTVGRCVFFAMGRGTPR